MRDRVLRTPSYQGVAPRGRLRTGWTSGGSGGPGGRRPSTGCSEALAGPPGLFSGPWPGLGGVLLVRLGQPGPSLPFCRPVWLSAAGRPCRHKRSVRLWWLRLPGVLEVLPQPGGQRLAHLVQQLGELDVVVPVVVLQEGAGLQREGELSSADGLSRAAPPPGGRLAVGCWPRPMRLVLTHRLLQKGSLQKKAPTSQEHQNIAHRLKILVTEKRGN